MRKLIIVTLTVVFATSLALAQKPDMKREEMQKDFKEMSELVTKYNKEKSKKKKTLIEEQIKTKVSANYDRHLQRMEERIKISEERLQKAREMLAKSQTKEAKEEHVDKVTAKILSGEKPMLFSPPPDWRKSKGAPRHHSMMPPPQPDMDMAPGPQEPMMPPPPAPDMTPEQK